MRLSYGTTESLLVTTRSRVYNRLKPNSNQWGWLKCFTLHFTYHVIIIVEVAMGLIVYTLMSAFSYCNWWKRRQSELALAKCTFYPQLLLFATVRSLTSHRWVSRLFTETAGSDGNERSVSLTQAVNILTTVGRQVNPHYGAAIFQVCVKEGLCYNSNTMPMPSILILPRRVNNS